MDIYSPTKPVYYVYAYLREDYTPYYIGKGKGDRSHKHRNKTDIKPPKDKSRIIILHDNLTEVYAFILERYYIRWFGRKDINTGILRNLTDGGDGTSGRVVSEEHKKKLSLVHKGRTLSEETKTKISEAKKGKTRTFSEEHKQNIGKAGKGRTHSEESKKKMALTKKGRTHSEETKQKISLANKGKTFSDEHKKNMSLAHKGKIRTFSEEHKKNMSLAHKGKTHCKRYNLS